jgi:hypothetical protein
MLDDPHDVADGDGRDEHLGPPRVSEGGEEQVEPRSDRETGERVVVASPQGFDTTLDVLSMARNEAGCGCHGEVGPTDVESAARYHRRSSAVSNVAFGFASRYGCAA